MLNNIPSCISPELMKTMMSMGHGDKLILADADFPAETFGKHVIRADGISMIELAKAILRFFPIDSYVEKPVAVMAPVGDAVFPETLISIKKIIKNYHPKFDDYEYIERFAFYERAREAFAIVATSEADGNLILQKGVVSAENFWI